MRTFADEHRDAIGVDLIPSRFTSATGSIADRSFVKAIMNGVDTVIHAATLHKPHLATHSRQDFIDTNITGTLNVLEEATAAGVRAFVYTSTTSVFGKALTPKAGEPAAWITEAVAPIPKNIYGLTKLAAENLCELFHSLRGLPCVILRVSRFFPEDDDRKEIRSSYDALNAKVNEMLYRRTDIADVVQAHILALEKAPALGFGRYVISATTPFTNDDLRDIRSDAPGVLRRRVPEFEEVFAVRGWTMFPNIDAVYVNDRARSELGWSPIFDFRHSIACLRAGEECVSSLARAVGAKGYHGRLFSEGPYPVE